MEIGRQLNSPFKFCAEFSPKQRYEGASTAPQTAQTKIAAALVGAKDANRHLARLPSSRAPESVFRASGECARKGSNLAWLGTVELDPKDFDKLLKQCGNDEELVQLKKALGSP